MRCALGPYDVRFMHMYTYIERDIENWQQQIMRSSALVMVLCDFCRCIRSEDLLACAHVCWPWQFDLWLILQTLIALSHVIVQVQLVQRMPVELNNTYNMNAPRTALLL